MCTPQLDRSETVTKLYREEKREEGERGGQEEKRGESKGERQIQLVISSLCVLHSLDHLDMFTELHREEGGGETELVMRIKGGIKRRETYPASNQFPKCSPPSGTHKEIYRVG